MAGSEEHSANACVSLLDSATMSAAATLARLPLLTIFTPFAAYYSANLGTDVHASVGSGYTSSTSHIQQRETAAHGDWLVPELAARISLHYLCLLGGQRARRVCTARLHFCFVAPTFALTPLLSLSSRPSR